MSERPEEVWSPWQPQAGMWVRVRRGPECPAHHSGHGADEDGAYGRIEWINREWDSPVEWSAAFAADGVTDEDPVAEARREFGHHYYVTDALDTGSVAWLDGHYCAAELVQVSEGEAMAGIVAARAFKATLTPDERLLRIVLGARR